jgi:formamidopyrimidine-DNA glycosylase
VPELPDVLLYLHALGPRVIGKTVRKVQVTSPFVLRTFDPPVDALELRTITRLDRIGKRIVFAFEDAADAPLYLVVHLMIAGRFRWAEKAGARPPGKIGLASLTFDHGTLLLVESSPKKRAAVHVVAGRDALRQLDPGGIDVLGSTAADFRAKLWLENHTLKRSLTDPRLFDGIGGAYADEILHAAQLSPVKLTRRLSDEEADRLHAAAVRVLSEWTDRLRGEFGDRFPGPGDVTAFRPGFAVHGKFNQPCPACGTAVQRIRYAETETDYCPRCQTGGKVLADRSLSRLLKDDWPATADELEARAAARPGGAS